AAAGYKAPGNPLYISGTMSLILSTPSLRQGKSRGHREIKKGNQGIKSRFIIFTVLRSFLSCSILPAMLRLTEPALA
ncbi:MAG: hypothetical protein ACR2RB_11045, partial [Gammaproteobacteria bacterium]